VGVDDTRKLRPRVGGEGGTEAPTYSLQVRSEAQGDNDGVGARHGGAIDCDCLGFSARAWCTQG
jgi:hypothetical protein